MDFYSGSAVNTKIMSFECNVKCDNNGLVISEGKLGQGSEKIEIEFSCTKGATIEKLSGDRFDIGNADEDDFRDLIEDIQDAIYDFMY